MSTTVFRVEKNREFVVMNNRFLRNKEMSLKAKGLLALCLSLPDTWNYSLNGLVAITKESQTAIRSTLKELEKFKHLKRNKLKDSKGQFIYEYVLYEIPYAPYTENLYMADLYADNPNIDEQYAENIREENKEQESINKESIEEKSLYIELEDILNKSVKNEQLRELYNQYIAMRKDINHPLSARGLKMLITRAERLSNMNIRVQKLLLENATINQWKNVYMPKEEEVKTANAEVLNELKNFYGE